MNNRTCYPIYALVIAPLVAPAVPLALVGDRALAAEMPKDFQGTWCTSSHTLKDDWHAYEGADCSDDYSSVEITATKVSILCRLPPSLTVSGSGQRTVASLALPSKWFASPYGLATAMIASDRPSPRRSSISQKPVSATRTYCANGSWRAFADRGLWPRLIADCLPRALSGAFWNPPDRARISSM
jgi:hypothetical protein